MSFFQSSPTALAYQRMVGFQTSPSARTSRRVRAIGASLKALVFAILFQNALSNCIDAVMQLQTGTAAAAAPARIDMLQPIDDGVGQFTTTAVPFGTRPYRSTTSSLPSRTQPKITLVPTVAGA